MPTSTTSLIGTAAVIVAGAVAYYAATRGFGSGQGGGETKGKQAKGGSLKGRGQEDNSSITKSSVFQKNEKEEPSTYTQEEIKAMPLEKRKELANSFKAKGNTEYGKRNFEAASKLYTSAIEISPTTEPVFYSNRAACFMNTTPPLYDLVVTDCDSALSLDPNYVKALNRRALALEGLQRYEEALRDFTAATFLDKFPSKSTPAPGEVASIERVINIIATEKAAKILKDRKPHLPSHSFISAYLSEFRSRPHCTIPANASTGDNTFLLGLQQLEALDYPHASTSITESLEQGISWNEGKAEALNLRGTFKFLMGDVDGAKADLQASLKIFPSLTQSLVKLANVHMEQGDAEMAFGCFNQAIAQNPDDADIYHHRGQALSTMDKFKEAAEDYMQSTKIDDQFVFSHIQLAVAQQKDGNIEGSTATFQKTLKAFPKRSEPQNYYGELLLDQQQFEDAVEKFERAIELEKTMTLPNVLPLVNKALALFRWKNDIAAAEACCNEALQIDPECVVAMTTLAQLSSRQGKLDQAAELFARQAELARSELGLVNALIYQHMASAQVEFMKNYPHMAAQLRDVAMGLV
ncbi:mitochondrial outer membrane translocase receptor TOM70 [Pluteus cervinus]|uniref:Mitochondrial outer membrane translocase receptor TOM70 n=1 Tax=Pluteus cervinus TaxID=181527 RepID=A0ACD3B3S1_9AGAR|nr:mitochondrial outer membrane translocase receptor TOM70 [Pluteus cervinus]